MSGQHGGEAGEGEVGLGRDLRRGLGIRRTQQQRSGNTDPTAGLALNWETEDTKQALA